MSGGATLKASRRKLGAGLMDDTGFRIDGADVRSVRVASLREQVSFVLHDGRIVEQGTPAELARSGGVFADLYSAYRQPV